MPLCRNCGAIASHIRTVFEVAGRKLPEPKDQCENCGLPAEKLTTPSDQKLWLSADANPNEYEYRDGVRVMKDWAQAEFQERISQEDADVVAMEERAKARKRQHARERNLMYGGSLPESAVKQIDSELREQRARESALDAGLVLPA